MEMKLLKMEALKQDSDISKNVSMEELAKNEYVLMPKRYLNTIKIENGVNLIDLMKKQGRGMNIASPDLSEQDTGNGRYLMLQNISLRNPKKIRFYWEPMAMLPLNSMDSVPPLLKQTFML